MEARVRYFVAAGVVLALLFFFHVLTVPKEVPDVFYSPEAHELPLLALYSFSRMAAAFVLALVFSVAYGYFAATTRWRRVLLPVIDVLQSVPVLGFFPVAMLFLLTFFHGSLVGLEIASVLLIFTSMAWNMTFGVYESITTIPKDLLLAAESFGLSSWMKFKRLYFPACVPKLVYNSMMSWTNGWYFLIACEIISLGGQTYRLRGIGSFLVHATASGRLDLTALGVGTLVLLILLLDVLVWRPHQEWANRFKYETFVKPHRVSRVYLFYKTLYWMPLLKTARKDLLIGSEEFFSFLQRFFVAPFARFSRTPFGARFLSWAKSFVFFAIGGVSLWIVFSLASFFWNSLQAPLPEGIYDIPSAIAFSTLRLAIAYFISLFWTVPAAVFVWRNEGLKRVLMPFFEVAASIPATALFPVMVLAVVGFTGSVDLAAVLLILLGMQWYLFFNILAGLNAIPNDVLEAADSFGLKGWVYWKRVLLPAIMPSLVTGSISAWGGGWNALFVAEYFFYGGRFFEVEFGIGKSLNYAVYSTGDLVLIAYLLLAMVAAILFVNAFVWRRLYALAANKYSVGY